MNASLENAKNHFQMGVNALSKENFFQAEKELRLANQLAPNRPSILTNLSTTLIRQQRWSEAIEFCNQLLEFEPNNSDGLLNLGVCKLHNNECTEALHYFERVIQIDPTLGSAWVNKGNLLLEEGMLEEAAKCFNKTLDLGTHDEEALIGLGNLHNELEEYKQGIECFSKVLEINPNNAQAKWNKAISLLRVGDFKEGWKLYESRWDISGMREYKKNLGSPLWLGKEPLNGKTILIVAEQGYGDTIQFCRYIPKLESMGAKVVMAVPNSLIDLMQTISSSVTIVPDENLFLESLLGDIDFFCPIMSLALAFETTLKSIPNHLPYLFVDEKRRNYWHKKMRELRINFETVRDPFRVGISWTGSGHYAGRKNPKRDIPPKEFANLINGLREKRIEFHSLQIEEHINDVLLKMVAGNLIKHDQDLKNFSDTAALMMELDLIVSIDTATAHLAGALNRPTLLLIPRPPDFMALTEGNHSPWYPNTTVLRQQERKKWCAPLSQVKDLILSKYE